MCIFFLSLWHLFSAQCRPAWPLPICQPKPPRLFLCLEPESLPWVSPYLKEKNIYIPHNALLDQKHTTFGHKSENEGAKRRNKWWMWIWSDVPLSSTCVNTTNVKFRKWHTPTSVFVKPHYVPTTAKLQFTWPACLKTYTLIHFTYNSQTEMVKLVHTGSSWWAETLTSYTDSVSHRGHAQM